MLIVYFSHSGNTRKIAEQIHKSTDAGLIELKTIAPYPADYNAVTTVAQREKRANARPHISTEVPDWDTHDTVFLGFPNWWGTFPMPFYTFLEKYNPKTKTLIPFCTHEGSKFGIALRELKKLCPHAKLLDGFEIRGSKASTAQDAVDAWLRKIGLLHEDSAS